VALVDVVLTADSNRVVLHRHDSRRRRGEAGRSKQAEGDVRAHHEDELHGLARRTACQLSNYAHPAPAAVCVVYRYCLDGVPLPHECRRRIGCLRKVLLC